MKKIFKTLMLVLAVTVCVKNVHAQSCSATDKTTIRTCVYNSVNTCRDATAACNEFEPALTLKDVQTLAITTCCGRSSKTARNICLLRQAQRYQPILSAGLHNTFFKAARAVVKSVRVNLCKKSTYTLPADSALF